MDTSKERVTLTKLLAERAGELSGRIELAIDRIDESLAGQDELRDRFEYVVEEIFDQTLNTRVRGSLYQFENPQTMAIAKVALPFLVPRSKNVQLNTGDGSNLIALMQQRRTQLAEMRGVDRAVRTLTL